MDKDELIELIDKFINEVGIWPDFVKWVEEQGYTTEELGFPVDE